MKRAAAIGATVGAIAGAVFIAMEYLWLYIGDSLVTFLFGGGAALLFGGALLGILVSLIQMIIPKFRRRAISNALTCLFIVGFVGLASLGASMVRSHGLREAADRAVPLIQAIRDYENSSGRPPESLEALVPSGLDAIPGTGLGVHRNFEYETGPGSLAERTGNSWVIYIPASRGPLDWSMFIYCPNQEYDQDELDGAVERVDEWAFIAE